MCEFVLKRIQSDSFSINVNVTVVKRTFEQSQFLYNSIVETVSTNKETIEASVPSGFVGNVSVEAINPPIPLNQDTTIADSSQSSIESYTTASSGIKNYIFTEISTLKLFG
jgi:hypothetical protein